MQDGEPLETRRLGQSIVAGDKRQPGRVVGAPRPTAGRPRRAEGACAITGAPACGRLQWVRPHSTHPEGCAARGSAPSTRCGSNGRLAQAAEWPTRTRPRWPTTPPSQDPRSAISGSSHCPAGRPARGQRRKRPKTSPPVPILQQGIQGRTPSDNRPRRRPEPLGKGICAASDHTRSAQGGQSSIPGVKTCHRHQTGHRTAAVRDKDVVAGLYTGQPCAQVGLEIGHRDRLHDTHLMVMTRSVCSFRLQGYYPRAQDVRAGDTSGPRPWSASPLPAGRPKARLACGRWGGRDRRGPQAHLRGLWGPGVDAGMVIAVRLSAEGLRAAVPGGLRPTGTDQRLRFGSPLPLAGAGRPRPRGDTAPRRATVAGGWLTGPRPPRQPPTNRFASATASCASRP